MALRKISITLLAALISLAAGDFGYERFKSLGFDAGLDSNAQGSWFSDSYPAGFDRSETRVIPFYTRSPYPYDSLKHGTNPIPSVVGIKKIPKEDKDFKKKISPFYTLSDSDDPKFKELILKTGAPHCQQIDAKNRKTDVNLGSGDPKHVTCYRCKDPKNGATYEHCSYTSQPGRTHPARESRSNAAEKSLDSLSDAATQYREANKPTSTPDKLSDSFRFSDDYFQPEASHELPAEYEKNIDNCERVVKDSMICMVCKDPKTSGKYEQCSYVAQPNEKAFAYTKSSSFGPKKRKPHEHAGKEDNEKPRKVQAHRGKDDEGEHDHRRSDHRRYRHREPEELSEREEPEQVEEESAEDKEGHHSHYVPDHSYHYPSYKDYKSSYDSYDADDEDDDSGPKQSGKSSTNCKVLEKDGQTCTMCTNPKTGGKSENCNYSHEPKDKVYKYSKSKSFGYPESQRSTEAEGDGDAHEKATDSTEKRERQSNADDYGSYGSEPSTLDYIRSESEKISEKVKGKGDCQKVKKDGMVCTICKDPKSGGDFEQCNYSYDPDDKVYAYSKSTSFGSPTKASGDSDDYGASDSEEHPEETYSVPVIYPTGTSPLDYIPKTGDTQSSLIYATEKPQVQSDERQDTTSGSKVDSGFYDATVRRAEIEKIVKGIGAEDRSKCKKSIRGGMTCYRCTDSKGFTNEECVYVTEPEVESTKEKRVQLKDTELLFETTIEPLEGVVPTTTTTTTTTTTSTAKLLDPVMSTSWKSVVINNRKIREAKEKEVKDQDEELEPVEEEQREAEPYDYVAETRPVYDKVLGITLPAYMLQKSAHELEFDAMVENSKF